MGRLLFFSCEAIGKKIPGRASLQGSTVEPDDAGFAGTVCRSMVGAEGERLSRFVDTREHFGIRDAIPEAQSILTELLQSSGIVNMAAAFGSLNNMSSTVAVNVRQGHWRHAGVERFRRADGSLRPCAQNQRGNSRK